MRAPGRMVDGNAGTAGENHRLVVLEKSQFGAATSAGGDTIAQW